MLTAIIVVFVIGYLAIVFEHQIHVNKAASAILTGVLCWAIYAVGYDQLAPQSAFEKWERMHVTSEMAEHATADHATAEQATAEKSSGETVDESQPTESHLPSKLLFVTEYQLGHSWRSQVSCSF